MANHNQNGGRNVALPEDHQPSWRPQDDAPERRGRYPERYADDERAWRDRGFGGEEWRPSAREPRRWDPGQGERGHGYGDRYGDQRLQQLQDRFGRDDAMPSPGSFEDRYRDMGRDLGIDDRGAGRDRGTYWADRSGSDAARDGYRGRDFEPERRGLSRGHEERMGYPTAARGRGDERMGYAAGSYGRGYGGSGSTGPEPHVHRGIGPHRGKGPAGYQRSDDRIRELVCESLTDDDQIDASQIEIAVRHGEVTLSGRVDDRSAKREAEDCAWSVAGVRDVQNQLRVRGAAAGNPPGASAVGTSETETSAPDRKHRS